MAWEPLSSGTLQLGEFDSFFEYSLTSHMIQYGLGSPYWPTHWINMQQNYPWGLDMNSLPILPWVGAITYEAVSAIGININLMTFLSILPVFLATLAVLVLYFIGKDLGGKTVGLLAALFLALDPSVIGRSNLGWYETEAVGVLGLLLYILLFLRANDTKRSLNSCIVYSVLAGLALAFFTGGWGSAYYLFGLVAIFAFVMIILKRYNHRLLLSYAISFGLGLFLSINMTYLTIDYLLTAPVLAASAVFVLLFVSEIWQELKSMKYKTVLSGFIIAALAGGLAYLWHDGKISSIATKFVSTVDPFYRVDTPILASVAEHAITSWGQMYVEFGISILFFIIGLYFVIRNPTTKNIFLILFGLTGLYFAASMVRLLVILAPAFGLIAALGIVGVLKPFYLLLKEPSHISVKAKQRLRRVGKEFSIIAVLLIFVLLVSNLAFSPQTNGVPRAYSSAYVPLTITASSLPLATSVPQWSNMLNWMKTNLNSTTVVSAWWDYGEWLTVQGNVTTITDNTTENTTQIENQAYSFMATETQSLQMLQHYNASYVLVFVTLELQASSSGYSVGFAGYGDEGKWSWMASISGEAQSRFMSNESFGTSWMNNEYNWTNQNNFGLENTTTNTWQWNAMGLNSTIFKLLSNVEQTWASENDLSNYISGQTGATPTYFTLAHIEGLDVTTQYEIGTGVYLIPLVALYQINWSAYDNATSTG